MEIKYIEIEPGNGYQNHQKKLKKIFNEIYGIALNHQIEDMLKILNNNGYAVCIRENHSTE